VIPEIIKVKGGLMLGVEFDFDVSALRKDDQKHILQVDLVIKIFKQFNYCNNTFAVALAGHWRCWE
jgi:hypothetical protein